MKTTEEIQRHLAEAIEDIRLGAVVGSDVKPSDRLLDDLGLDSLDYASVVLGAEQWLGVRIAEHGVAWGDLRTVEQLSDLLYRSQPGAADS